MKALWRSSWIGIVYTYTSIAATVVYIYLFGPMFGEWGWVHIASALLILGILVVTAVGALDHQPNPYGRTHPLYDLKDVSTHTSFQGAGFAWITQLLPMVIAIAGVLLVAQFL